MVIRTISTGRPIGNTLRTVPFWGLLVIAVAMVLMFRCFPSQDGPLHLYYSEVVKDLIFNAGQNYGSGFVLTHYLSPYVFDTYLLATLSFVFDPLVSEKILVGLYVLGFCLGFRYLVHSIAPRNEVAPLLAFALVFNHFIYWGFYNFCLGLAMALWAVGYWVRFSESFTWKRSAGFAAWIAIISITHPVALCLCLLFFGFHLVVVFCIAFFGEAAWRTNAWARLTAAFATCLRPGLHLAAAASVILWVVSFSSQPSKMTATGDTFIARILDNIMMWELTPVVGRTYRWGYLLILLMAFGSTAWAFLRFGKRVFSVPAVSLTLTGCAGLALSLFTPAVLAGGLAVGPRVAFFALLLVVAGAAVAPLSFSVARMVGTSIVIVTLASFSYLSVLTQHAIAKQSPFLDVLAAAPGLNAVSVTGDQVTPKELHSAPDLWAAAHYARRSKAILSNFGWLELSLIPLAPRNPGPCPYTRPDHMARCLADASPSPVPDLMIALSIDVASLATRYGLKPLSGEGNLVVYSKPGIGSRPRGQ